MEAFAGHDHANLVIFSFYRFVSSSVHPPITQVDHVIFSKIMCGFIISHYAILTVLYLYNIIYNIIIQYLYVYAMYL